MVDTKKGKQIVGKKFGGYKIQILDASSDLGQRNGYPNTYGTQEENPNKSHNLEGLYIIQSKLFAIDGYANSKNFLMAEHYASVEEIIPEKIHIEVPSTYSLKTIKYDYTRTKDEGQYKDAQGTIVSLQEIYDRAKKYGFTNLADSRFTCMYRAAYGVKKDENYPIIPRKTETIIALLGVDKETLRV